MATAAKMSPKKGICAVSNFITVILHCQMLGFFQELNSRGLYLISQHKKENHCLVFMSSTKCENRKLQIVFEQWQQKNVQKSMMHVQSCCFANLNLMPFCCCCCRHHCVISSLISLTRKGLCHQPSKLAHYLAHFSLQRHLFQEQLQSKQLPQLPHLNCILLLSVT